VHRLQQPQGEKINVRLRICQQGSWRRDGQPISGEFGLQWLCGDQLRGVWPRMMPSTVKIGTRGSQLALWQANWVKSELMARHPQLNVELVIIKTKGDKILDVPLAKVGGKGLFVKEIENALLTGQVDIAVHSMKDMPAEIPSGLTVGAIPERETPWDALVSRKGEQLVDLPKGSRIGTSSLRRAAQLKNAHPTLEIEPLRGNLDTRLRKLHEQKLAAIVLAAAGLQRLGQDHHITEIMTLGVMVPAVGQGALCIEVRANDPAIGPLVDELNHEPTRTAVIAERAFLKRLEGGCQVPIAGYARLDAGRVKLTGLVADLDGREIIRQDITGDPGDAAVMGVSLAEQLLAGGADDLLKDLKNGSV
jgi:hydroxymethylbilane synthase